MKFRVWDIEASTYRHDCCLGCNGVLWFNGDSLEEDKFIVQFQTGFTDTRGVEIYDGDIVMYANDYPGSYDPPEPPEANNDFAVVQWHDEGRWELNAKPIKHNRSFDPDWIHEYKYELEVIGNIYEDNGLLNNEH